MKLQNLEFIKLLPDFMKDDGCVKALSESINTIFRPAAQNMKKLSDWNRIDSMTETELDELAWECDISWYDKTADIETKRSICKNSDKIFMTRATSAAVEEVISTYFKNASLQEFWECGCRPHHFKIQCDDISAYTENLDLFLSVLEKVKRKSQWLDSIILLLAGDLKIYASAGAVESIYSEFNCINPL